jgi:hypothetical protein
MSCVLKGKHGGKITRGRDKVSLSKISFQLNLGKKNTCQKTPCMDLDCFLYRILIQDMEQYTLKLFCFFLRNQSFIIYKIQILPLINSYISLCKNYEEKKNLINHFSH